MHKEGCEERGNGISFSICCCIPPSLDIFTICPSNAADISTQPI